VIVVADVEADGLDPTKIHCLVCKPIGEEAIVFYEDDKETFKIWVECQEPIVWVFHNGLGYDVPVLNRLWGEVINPKKVIDTMVVSKTVDYKKFRTHSLAEVGEHLKFPKDEYNGGWETCTPEMVEYCKRDVEVTSKFYESMSSTIFDPSWKPALRLEHDTAILCHQLQETGFKFDVAEADRMLQEVLEEQKELEESFNSAFGIELTELGRVPVRYKKDGSLFVSVLNKMLDYPDSFIDEDTNELVVMGKKEFNPGSPQQRIDLLWKYGWRPTDKTKGHQDFLRNNK